jgi:hypothetical protein
MNLYLDKKFINKLLIVVSEKTKLEKLKKIMDEVITYFCLDFLALRIESDDTILTYKSSSTNNYHSDQELRSIFQAKDMIEENIGNIKVREDRNRDYIIFKNGQVTLLAIVEAKHNLSSHEKDTLGNEIINMIKMAIFTSINNKVSLRDFINS